MKLMIISDIHGNIESAKKALEIFDEEKADELIILGDYFFSLIDHKNHYSVSNILNKYKNKIIGILGNWDDDASKYLDFPLYDNYEKIYDKTLFYFTHGHIYNKNNLPKLKDGEIFIQGHDHIPFYTMKDTHVVLSPGSIGHPLHNSKKAYIIIDKGNYYIKDFETKKVINKEDLQ